MNANEERLYQIGYRDGLDENLDQDLKVNPFYWRGYQDGRNAKRANAKVSTED